MGKFDTGAIAAIKDRLDIVEMVRRYVDLRPLSGRWTGPCPFHQETKPSFSVNSQLGYYYCFGCRASGDVIDFYKEINGLEFKDALQQLAEEAGVELSGTKPDPGDARRRRERSTSLNLHQAATEFFVSNLGAPSGKVAQEYIAERQLSPEVVQAFALGYSPDDWHGFENFTKAKGYDTQAAVVAGLLVKNDRGNIYDRFRGRLMFPIHSLTGQVIAFGARTLSGDDPKYLNSSESPIYTKGDNLYGLYQARRSIAHNKEALLTEGYTDVLSLHQFGFDNACGVLGTALTEKQVRRLAGFCSKLALVFDGDGAGRKAALRSAEMVLARGMTCRVVMLPDGEDVDSLLQKQGPEAFKACLDEAMEGLDYCLRVVSGQSTRELVEWADTFLKQLDEPEWRSPLITRLAQKLGFREEEFRAKLAREGAAGAKSSPSEGATRILDRGHKLDRQLMRFAVCNPQYVQQLAAKGMGRFLVSEFALCLWEKMEANPGRDVMHILTPSEKRYWVECLEANTKNEEESEREWAEIGDFLQREGLLDEKQAVFEALRRAQLERDGQEQRRLSALYLEISRRLDEQH